jgi:hypothetical protein
MSNSPNLIVRIRRECDDVASANAGPGVDGAGDADIPGVDAAVGMVMCWTVDDRSGRYNVLAGNACTTSGAGSGEGTGASFS